MPAASIAGSVMSGVRPFVCVFCPVYILTAIHQAAASDAASVHFGPTIRRTDVIIVSYTRVEYAFLVTFKSSLESNYRYCY